MGNETLYYNGTVLTMEEPLYAGALLVRDGRIAAVGSERELSALCPEAGRVDLRAPCVCCRCSMSPVLRSWKSS